MAKFSYGGKSYKTRSSARAASRADGGASSTRGRSSSGGSSRSSNQVGLNDRQVAQLRGNSGINQNALSSYVDSGSAVGGSNNPRGRGRENTITSDSVRVVPQVPLPSEKVSVVGDIAQNNVGLVGADSSLSQSGNLLQQEPAPVEGDKFSGATAIYDKYVSDITQEGEDRTTGADVQRQLERDTGIRDLRQKENDLSSQLNTIVANRDAAKLGLEGQGRGINETIIGGQQARVDKEAAIQALPIQAQLAHAQGNVALAEAHIATWGSILMNDANNAYNQKKELLTGAKDFAIGIEGKRIDELNKKNDRKYAEEQSLITAKTAALSNALGQGAPASVSAAIQSATTAEEVVAASGIYNGDVLGRAEKQASINASNASAARSETGRLLDLAEAGDAAAISELGLTMPDNSQPTADDMAYARQYAATGKVPAGMSAAKVSFGDIAELASDLPKRDGAVVDINTNVASSNLSSADNVSFDALFNAINSDLPLLIEAFEEMSTLSMQNPGGTGLIGGVISQAFPSEANIRFEAVKADFVAKLVLARSGAAATEDEVDRYMALVPGKFNTVAGLGTEGTLKLEALQNQMTSAFDDKLDSRGLSVYGYSTTDIGGESYTVGEIITSEYGQQGRVNPDGSITLINN